MKWLNRFLTPPTAKMQAERELLAARRDLLVALSASEYATKMSQYHAERIARLEKMLGVTA